MVCTTYCMFFEKDLKNRCKTVRFHFRNPSLCYVHDLFMFFFCLLSLKQLNVLVCYLIQQEVPQERN